MQTNTTLMRSLAAIVILACFLWTVTDAEKVTTCCVTVSKFMEDIPITGYILQKKNLPCVQAVIFLTEKGQFCIHPYQPWVRSKINEFRRSQKNKMSPTSASLRLTASSVPQNSTVSTRGGTTNHNSLQ